MTDATADSADRPAIDWKAADFLDGDALDRELRRVFGVCHDCRRCGDLCDSFPRLFDLIDGPGNGVLHDVKSGDFRAVADACTLCDMCHPVCSYTSPHVHAVDFPNLMARYRAWEKHETRRGFFELELGKTDRNGRLMGFLAPFANWAARHKNRLTRPLMEAVAGIHRDAVLPRFHARTFTKRAESAPPSVNDAAPAYGRKAVLYATCYVEYNNPGIGVAAQSVLARNGVETATLYPTCCGMPQLERGDIEAVCERAGRIAAGFGVWIDEGYDVISLIPSCTLMLKTIWPLYLPDDPAVARLAAHTSDIVDYIVGIARREGLAEGLAPLKGGVALHHACHARAQNAGRKSAVMMRMIPECDVLVIEGCSGHGGSWGVMKGNFPVGMKIGERVARQAADRGCRYLASECPLAGDHIVQGLERLRDNGTTGVGTAGVTQSHHPIELLAMSYGIEG
mgnify:CR=1 FL=1|jgi:glycerol-3-phosphate dehydrogenase subunit C